MNLQKPPETSRLGTIKQLGNKNILPGAKPKYEVFILLVLFLLALAIRMQAVLAYPEEIRSGFGPFTDTHLYHSIAFNLVNGNGFSGIDNGAAYGMPSDKNPDEYTPAIIRGPVYPFFLASVYSLLGNDDQMRSLETWHIILNRVRVVQGVLDALICIIVYLMVRAVTPQYIMPALFAAILYSFSVYNIYYIRSLLTEAVTTFIIANTLLFIVLALKYSKKHWWILSGIFFGLTVLSRPEYLLFSPIAVCLILFHNRSNIKQAIWLSAVFILGAIFVITPWTLRNYTTFKRPILVSTGGLGYVLFLGTFETRGNWRGYGKYPENIYRDDNEKKLIRKLSHDFRVYSKEGTIEVVDIDNNFKEIALNKIRENPLKCLKIWISRIHRLWYQRYDQIYYYKQPSGNFFIFYFLFAIVAILGLDSRGRLLVAPIILMFLYLNMIFLPLHIEPRYGVALMPGIISLAGIGCWKVFQFLRILLNRNISKI
jgi:4-amino-4-deoxy-L-arabinose transferase-like glycosyltransferase